MACALVTDLYLYIVLCDKNLACIIRPPLDAKMFSVHALTCMRIPANKSVSGALSRVFVCAFATLKSVSNDYACV